MIKKRFCKCWINLRTRYIHRNQLLSAIVPNAFSVASDGSDERKSRESRPGDETRFYYTMNFVQEQGLAKSRSHAHF